MRHSKPIQPSKIIRLPRQVSRAEWFLIVGCLLAVLGLVSWFGIASLPARPSTATRVATQTQLALAKQPTATRSVKATFAQTPSLVSATITPSANPYPSGKVAFAQGILDDLEIYLITPNGSNMTQLTSNAYQDDSPTFSPDGQYLAYASKREDGWEIYILDLQTLVERQLTRIPESARFPAWSPVPSDDRIVFERRNGVNIGVWIVEVATGELHQVTEWGANSRPSWSADASQIVFGRALADNTKDGLITSSDFLDIFTHDVQTGFEQNLTNSPGADDFNMSWSPDGRWIAYTSIRGDTNSDGFINLDDRSGLYIMQPDGSNAINITGNQFSAFSPSWSADSSQIAFVNNLGPNNNEIWIINREGGDPYQVTPRGPYFHPEWSR